MTTPSDFSGQTTPSNAEAGKPRSDLGLQSPTLVGLKGDLVEVFEGLSDYKRSHSVDWNWLQLLLDDLGAAIGVVVQLQGERLLEEGKRLVAAGFPADPAATPPGIVERLWGVWLVARTLAEVAKPSNIAKGLATVPADVVTDLRSAMALIPESACRVERVQFTGGWGQDGPEDLTFWTKLGMKVEESQQSAERATSVPPVPEFDQPMVLMPILGGQADGHWAVLPQYPEFVVEAGNGDKYTVHCGTFSSTGDTVFWWAVSERFEPHLRASDVLKIYGCNP